MSDNVGADTTGVWQLESSIPKASTNDKETCGVAGGNGKEGTSGNLGKFPEADG
jgi:hypothetical protein